MGKTFATSMPAHHVRQKHSNQSRLARLLRLRWLVLRTRHYAWGRELLAPPCSKLNKGWLCVKLPAQFSNVFAIAVRCDRPRLRRRTGRPAARAAGRHRPINPIYACCDLQVLTCCYVVRCMTSSSRPQCELPCHLEIAGWPNHENSCRALISARTSTSIS